MKRIEVNPSVKFVLVLGGSEYPMARPKLGVVREYERRLAEAKAAGSGGVELVMNFIVSCGLPESVVEDLDQDQLEQIVLALNDAKKN